MAAPTIACYSAVSCNRTPNSLTWPDGTNSYFGSSNSIAVYSVAAMERSNHLLQIIREGVRANSAAKPFDRLLTLGEGIKDTRVIATCHGHDGRVNAVCSIQKDGLTGSCSVLVSVSSDNSAAVWRIEPSGQLALTQKLNGHTSSVNVCCGATLETAESHRTTIATASSDSTVKIWKRIGVEDKFSCDQTLAFGTGFVLGAAMIRIPRTNDLLLACGCDDMKIHLYAEQNEQFVKIHSLVGHEDWVRGVEFTLADNGDILLASCAQDHYIRIWRMSSRDPGRSTETVATPGGELKMKERAFTYRSRSGEEVRYAITLETVLAGHDGWVYAAHWQPAVQQENGRHQPMCLLSASMDKTMIIWAPEQETGLWTEKIRVGTVGGNTLGLYGCQFSPDGASVVAHGYQGALHLWHRRTDSDVESWRPGVTVGGHFDDVTDLAWDPNNGDFLLTVSADQSTRLHGEWKQEGKKSSWHELARPQVHGYDLHCMTMIDKFRFASGADEKVIRVFTAPRNFVANFCRMCDKDLATTLTGMCLEDLPEGASIPSLGLSNKAVYDKSKGDAGNGDNQNGGASGFDQSMKPSDGYFQAAQLEEPPCEEDLLQNTLWPETYKLYGHGYEIFSLAASPDGKQLASACKAAKPEHANILIWDTTTWKQSQSLTSHSLTVTRLAYSPCSRYLLSVSRDRTWTLFKRNDELSLVPVAGTDKKTGVHSRIIWSCAWSRDSEYFVTVSRDKKAIVWRLTDEQGPLGCVERLPHVLELSKPITAVDVAPVLVNGRYLCALGLETGRIELHTFSEDKGWERVHSLNTSEAHHNTVKRLRFRPVQSVTDDSALQLASCGMDNAVKIFEINIGR